MVDRLTTTIALMNVWFKVVANKHSTTAQDDRDRWFCGSFPRLGVVKWPVSRPLVPADDRRRVTNKPCVFFVEPTSQILPEKPLESWDMKPHRFIKHARPRVYRSPWFGAPVHFINNYLGYCSCYCHWYYWYHFYCRYSYCCYYSRHSPKATTAAATPPPLPATTAATTTCPWWWIIHQRMSWW